MSSPKKKHEKCQHLMQELQIIGNKMDQMETKLWTSISRMQNLQCTLTVLEDAKALMIEASKRAEEKTETSCNASKNIVTNTNNYPVKLKKEAANKSTELVVQECHERILSESQECAIQSSSETQNKLNNFVLNDETFSEVANSKSYVRCKGAKRAKMQGRKLNINHLNFQTSQNISLHKQNKAQRCVANILMASRHRDVHSRLVQNSKRPPLLPTPLAPQFLHPRPPIINTPGTSKYALYQFPNFNTSKDISSKRKVLLPRPPILQSHQCQNHYLLP